MAEALGTDVEACTPSELISIVLRAPVDLLWNGGIGTYVKASNERSDDIGDRTNDAVRVAAPELRCRVIGEGGNLGLSARARVEFARLGGKVNADAIDNSGGVNCSDREVNLKILLADALANDELTSKRRNALLMEMSDEVAALVLADSTAQARALGAARTQSAGMVDVHIRHLRWLERHIGLNRMLDGLPSDADLEHRQGEGEGLTQPELAVLLAHTKNALAALLEASDLPDDPAFDDMLVSYFPTDVREVYAEAIQSHPLRRELVSMLVANRIVNRSGVTSSHRLAEETSASFADIARAHVAAWRLYELDQLWTEVAELDASISARVRTGLLLDIRRLGERATRWLLRNTPAPLDIDKTVARLSGPLATLGELLPDMVVGTDAAFYSATLEGMEDANLPDDLARRFAGLSLAFGSLDLADVAENVAAPLEQVARIYFLLDDRLELSWLREHIVGLERDDHWYSMARSALRDDFFREHAAITANVVGDSNGDDHVALVDRWIEANSVVVDRCMQMFADIRQTEGQDLARASVALRELRHLAR